jgi:hypothetical protein
MNRVLSVSIVSVLCASSFAQGSKWFANSVVSSSNLGAAPYDNPAAALGKPTTWVRDTVNGGVNELVAASVVYPAFGTAPGGNPLLVTVRTGGQVTVAFDPPLFDDSRNWFGRDFIVFGNSFLANSSTITSTTDLSTVLINASGDFIELGTVSVSPDGLQWYSYPPTTTQAADAYWPTQAFLWTVSGWGAESDFTKPVPPSLTRASLTGRTAAQVIAAYGGSGGGCSFDLKPSGFPWVRYVRVTGASVEVDAISRVSWSRTTRLTPVGIIDPATTAPAP